MKITIGGQDYTFALDAIHPLTIERKLNEPSVCELWITLPAGASCSLARNESIQIAGDDGTTYFNGYLAAAHVPEYAGIGIEGPRYRSLVRAVSDEYLLDQGGMAPAGGSAGRACSPWSPGSTCPPS